MIGDIPIWTIVIGGILSLVVALKIWAYDTQKRKAREREKEEYRKKWEESEEFRKQEKEKYEWGFKEFLAKRQKEQGQRDTTPNKGKSNDQQ